MTTPRRITAAIILLGWLSTACGDDGGSGSGGSGAGAGGSKSGSSGAGGSASGAGGKSGAGGGGDSGGGSSGSGGSGGSSAQAACIPDPTFPADYQFCIELSDSLPPPIGYTLPSPMVAGQSYAVVFEVMGDGSPSIEFWGTSSACGAPAEELAAPEPLSEGTYCRELQPTAAHTELLMIQTGDVLGNGAAVERVCGDGTCQ